MIGGKVGLHIRTMLGLALVGVVDAGYDSYAIFLNQPLWCPPPIDGCNIVASSPYAHMLGLPVGYFGVVYYLCMLGLAILLALAPKSRASLLAAVLLAAVGVAFSAYFLRIQFLFIHAFCIYCLISAALTVLLLVVALSLLRAGRHAGDLMTV